MSPAWIGDCTHSAAYIAHFLDHKKNKNKQYFIYIYRYFFVKFRQAHFELCFLTLSLKRLRSQSFYVFELFALVTGVNYVIVSFFRVLLDLSTYGRVKSSTFKAASQPGWHNSPLPAFFCLVLISQHFVFQALRWFSMGWKCIGVGFPPKGPLTVVRPFFNTMWTALASECRHSDEFQRGEIR